MKPLQTDITALITDLGRDGYPGRPVRFLGEGAADLPLQPIRLGAGNIEGQRDVVGNVIPPYGVGACGGEDD
jgi:hypothetical protein